MTDQTQSARPSTVTQIAPELLRVIAPNPSPMTYWGTNTYVLGTGAQRVVIDPGPNDAAHLERVAAQLPSDGRLSHIFVTHAHGDHSAGAAALSERFGGAPVLAFGRYDAGRSRVMRALAAHDDMHGGEGIDTAFTPHQTLAHGAGIDTAAGPITALHTPGHMSNHMAFLWRDYCFTGDLIMGWSSSLISPPDGDAAAFRASCTQLLTGDALHLLPGHGDTVPDGAARIRELLAHRGAREAQILAYLGTLPKSAQATLSEITRAVYTDVPAAAHSYAQRNTLAHLIDLIEQKLVSATPDISTKAQFRRFT